MAEVFPSEILQHVKQLRWFLTQDTIDAATNALRDAEKSADILRRARLREVQPWLYAFDDYRKATLNGNRLPKKWPKSVYALATGGMAVPLITTSMPESVRRHHRSSLLCLSGRHAPCLAEWSAAYFYAKVHKASIAWTEPSKRGADFVASNGDLKFEVECKRHGSMIAELLGDAEAEALAGALLSLLQEQRAHGVLDVAVKTFPGVTFEEPMRLLREFLAAAKMPVEVSVETPELSIHGKLQESTQKGDFVTGFRELDTLSHDVRGYAVVASINNAASNLRLLRISGPRRTPNQLAEYLLEKMRIAAKEQLSATMAGVLVLEFARVDDPTAFRDSDGVQSILHELFKEHLHLAAVVLRAAPHVEDHDSYTHMRQFAYSAKSKVTTYPSVAELAHVSDDT